jgi:hypothetical protein
MRRWVCIVALLAGFTREDYVRSARLPDAPPVERLLGRRDRAVLPAGAWWRLPS